MVIFPRDFFLPSLLSQFLTLSVRLKPHMCMFFFWPSMVLSFQLIHISVSFI